MKAVVQRVRSASVEVDGRTVGSVARGFLVLVGVEEGDVDDDLAYLAAKIEKLRVFEDDAGKMSLALADVGGGILAVSQFTLLGDVRRGNRPSFVRAMRPDDARLVFDRLVAALRERLAVETGVFGADMQVSLVNDGPVTIWIDSRVRA